MTEQNKNILVNDLLVPSKSNVLKQASIVIHIDSGKDEIFLIGLGNRTKPEALPYREVLAGLIEEKIIKGKFEQSEYWKKPEKFATPQQINKRDQKFLIIKPLVDNLSKFLTSRNYGKGLVKSCLEIANQIGVKATRYQVYQWLYRYLKCKKNKNAFLRKPGTGKTTGKIYLNKTGPKRSEGRVCNGRMRTEADKKHIKSIVDEFHNCLTPIPITDCWYEYNKKYQSDPVYDQFTGEFIKYIERKGELHISEDQFKTYAYELVNKKRESVLKAQGLYDEYCKNVKGLSGDIHEFYGDAPGSHYQIDETPLAIELVDEFDRNRRLGKPTCYSVIDMFSRAWVGLLLTFAKPSAHTAREIVFIACRNKEVFCKEIGVKLGETWVPEGRCSCIIVDNAEFASALTDAFSDCADIEVFFNKEGNSQEKGLVERRHKTLEEFLFGRIPGTVNKKYVKDYLKRKIRKDAILNIRELYQILINYITQFNNHYPLKTLPLSKEMKEDRIKQIPIEKWNWGLTQRPGSLHSIEEDELYMRLLESGKVTVKRDGLFLQGKYIRTFKKRRVSQGLKYRCDWALSNKVYEKEIGEQYDCKFMRYSMSKIWIMTEDGFQEASLHPEDASFEWWSAECIQDAKIDESEESQKQLEVYHEKHAKTLHEAKSTVVKAQKEQSETTVHAANNQDLSFNVEQVVDREIEEAKKQLHKHTRSELSDEAGNNEHICSTETVESKHDNDVARSFAGKASKNRRRG